MGFWRRYGAYLAMAVSVVMLGLLLISPTIRPLTLGSFRLWWQASFSSYVWVLPLALVMLVGGVALNNWLERQDRRWLEWSPLGIKANMALLPLEISWLAWPYLVLLAVCMPLMAWFEEWIFRHLVAGSPLAWLIGSVVFGACHLLAGVSIRMAGYIGLVGGLLIVVYAYSGLIGAFLVHASYNLMALSWIVFELRLRRQLGGWLVRSAALRRQLPTVIGWLLKPQPA